MSESKIVFTPGQEAWITEMVKATKAGKLIISVGGRASGRTLMQAEVRRRLEEEEKLNK